MGKTAFRHKNPDEAIRELLRNEFGMTDEELRRLSPGQARNELFCRQFEREDREQARAALPDMIAEGIVTRRQAARLTDDDLVEMWRSLRMLRKTAPPAEVPTHAQVTRADVKGLTAAIERLTATLAGVGPRRVRRAKSRA